MQFGSVCSTLKKVQPRNDYHESLELTIIFVGGIQSRGVHFSKPGANTEVALWQDYEPICPEDIFVKKAIFSHF